MREAITRLVVEVSQKALQHIARLQQQLQQQTQQLQAQLQAISKVQSVQSQSPSMHLTASSNTLKKLEHQNRELDFALKKEMLKVENLKVQVEEQEEALEKLREENEEMRREREEQTEFRETMHYRVKQLKEELMVAQVLKEQSMEEKMKYIMHW